jgi:N-methylhydantoinase A
VPEEFILTCFGGAGGLHVCALADALRMSRAIVPVHAGVLSALGMLVAWPSRNLSCSLIQDLLSSEPAVLEEKFVMLERRGIRDMKNELTTEPVIQRSLDMRYQGQSFTLNIPWGGAPHADLTAMAEAFHCLHRSTYGHALNIPVELVNVRVTIAGEAPPFKLPELVMHEQAGATSEANCYGFDRPLPVMQRTQLVCGQIITGPALILEKVSSTLIAANWRCEVDAWGNLLLQRN